MQHAIAKRTAEFGPKSRSRETWGALPTYATSAAELFERLARADLTAAGYRVALDTIARLIRQGRVTESVTTQWLADRLNLHRNAVGAAYTSLADAGLVRRTTVTARGAPTRTTLIGPAALYVRALHQAFPASIDAGTENSDVVRPESARLTQHAKNSTPARVGASSHSESVQLTTRQTSATSQLASDYESGAESGRLTPIVEETGYIISTTPQHTTESGRLSDAESFDSSRGHSGRSGPDSSSTLQTHEDDAVPPKATLPKPKATYGAELHAAVASKVPRDAVYEVMQGNLRRHDIDPAWNLTDTEVECLMSLAPKREQPRVKKASAAIQAVPTRAHPLLAKVIWAKYSRLVALAGDKRAGELIDEIAFAATLGNLANGDQLASVRIIISIIARGTWTTPRGFTQDWRGAVLRGLNATTTGNGVAQISMH